MSLIKEKIRKTIEQSNLELAKTALSLTVDDEEMCTISSARLAYAEREYRLNKISSKEKRIEVAHVIENFYSILPENDFQILKTCLKRLILRRENKRALILFYKCKEYPTYAQSEEFEEIDIIWFNNQIDYIPLGEMKKDWENEVWKAIYSYHKGVMPEKEKVDIEIENYLDSIHEISEHTEDGDFILWEEYFTLGNYLQAFEISKVIHVKYPGKHLSYELLLISYVFVSDDPFKIAIKGTNENDLLMLYFERALKYCGISRTWKRTTTLVGNCLLDALKKEYDKSTQDYALRPLKKGKEKRKETVTKIFDSTINITNRFEIKGHSIFEKIFIEALGGGNFIWTKFRNDKILCDNGYDILFLTESLKKIDDFELEKSISLLLENIKFKKENLSIVPNQIQKKKMMADACLSANHLYPNKGFYELFEEIDIKIDIDDDIENGVSDLVNQNILSETSESPAVFLNNEFSTPLNLHVKIEGGSNLVDVSLNKEEGLNEHVNSNNTSGFRENLSNGTLPISKQEKTSSVLLLYIINIFIMCFYCTAFAFVKNDSIALFSIFVSLFLILFSIYLDLKGKDQLSKTNSH